jgi:hypothetical protein
MNNIINLADYLKEKNGLKSKVFTGRDYAKEIRVISNLDFIENQFDNVEIIIPDNIYSINPSFFEELFKNVVIKLGKKEFLRKFDFKSVSYDYQKSLNEAIYRIIREKQFK